jgi:hypothetical protein
MFTGNRRRIRAMRFRHPLLALGLTLVLLLAQGLAVAHDVDHAVGSHDAHCAFHTLASHSPGAPSSPPELLFTRSSPDTRVITDSRSPVTAFSSPFSARAPPRFA